MTTINSVNRLRCSAGSVRRAESAERLSLLTEFIVVIDESCPGETLMLMANLMNRLEVLLAMLLCS